MCQECLRLEQQMRREVFREWCFDYLTNSVVASRSYLKEVCFNKIKGLAIELGISGDSFEDEIILAALEYEQSA